LGHLSFGRKQSGNRVISVVLAVLSISVTFGISIGSASAAGQPARVYSATGHSVKGAFLNFFDRHGGVRIFGYPISEELMENGRPVQYFERQRLEYYREAAGTPDEVQGSRLGVVLARGKVSNSPVPPFASTSTQVYFKETGHSVSYPFLDFWKNNGQVRIFGYPISEMVNQNGITVQYFERARMEYHPQKAATGYGIELGQLGKEYIQAHPGVAAAIKQTPPSSTSNTSAASNTSNAGASQSAPQTQADTLSAREKQLMDHINSARRSAGLKPVAVDGRINNVSRSRSGDMAARGYFSHTTPEGRGFMQFLKAAGIAFTSAGEIIATNNYKAEEAAYQAYVAFMNSPAHRAIILDPRFTAAGVGEAKDGKDYYFFTVIFIQK